MHDDLPEFELNPTYRAFLEQTRGSSQDATALADLTLELGLSVDITQDEENDLHARVLDALNALDLEEPALPSALMRCPCCDGIRDRAPGGTISLCFCGGLVCRCCHAGRIHRPVSDSYDPSTGQLWHTPYFGNRARCGQCEALAKRLDETAWSATSQSLREAADALSLPYAALDDDLPPHALLALHGDVETWHALRLGSPPDSRPLFVGTALPRFRYTPPGLRVATWDGAGCRDVAGTHLELLLRWRPPLNDDVETPWSPAGEVGDG